MATKGQKGSEPAETPPPAPPAPPAPEAPPATATSTEPAETPPPAPPAPPAPEAPPATDLTPEERIANFHRIARPLWRQFVSGLGMAKDAYEQLRELAKGLPHDAGVHAVLPLLELVATYGGYVPHLDRDDSLAMPRNFEDATALAIRLLGTRAPGDDHRQSFAAKLKMLAGLRNVHQLVALEQRLQR